MDEIRRAGARIQLITDGDVNPIVNAGIEGTGVHMYDQMFQIAFSTGQFSIL